MNSFLQTDAVWRCFLGNLKDCAILILDHEGNVTAWNEGAYVLKSRDATEHPAKYLAEHPAEDSNAFMAGISPNFTRRRRKR